MVHLGKTFADNITLFKKKHRSISQTEFRGWGARISLLYILLLVSFFLLVLRLYHLTIITGEENRLLSEENRIRSTVIHAPRGNLFDRKGVALTENLPAVRIIGPCEDYLSCSPQLVTEQNYRQQKLSVPSIFLEKDYFRVYKYGNVTAHLLGYLSEISETELAMPYYAYTGYLPGDLLGKMGVEMAYEKLLRGQAGRELIEVDSENNKVRALGIIDSVAGNDLDLALDIDLQVVADQALADKPGVVIVSKPQTGEILTLVSKPTFDPNLIQQGLSASSYKQIFESEQKPLFNRAISGVYPPASTFKIIAAVAGLESGQIDTQTRIEDVGILRIGQFEFGNWYFTQYGQTEGSVDIYKAIARSNDIFFYKLGEAVGIDELAAWGKKFGIGEKLGIEISNEAQGVMPDPSWREKVRGDKWYLGDTYHVAIGQGDLQVTPLQVNFWTAAIANGGKLCQPTVIKNEATKIKKQGCRDLGISRKTIEIITEGMRRACSREGVAGVDYRGTGWPLFDFQVEHESFVAGRGNLQVRHIPVACKTGTGEFNDPQGKTHAWFTAFAPLPEKFIQNIGRPSKGEILAGEPEIAVTVLLEGGGEGSSAAGPIAKKIFEEWFRR